MSFQQFLAQLKQDAVAQGVSQQAIALASPYLVYDQSIVNRDRGQRVFGQLFTEFSSRMASEGRRVKGQQLIKTYAQAFSRAEKEYGVPPAVIAATETTPLATAAISLLQTWRDTDGSGAAVAGITVSSDSVVDLSLDSLRTVCRECI